MAVATIAGQQINLRSYGTGPRPVLALHCSLAHGGAWGPLAAELGDVVTMAAPDLPGHGQSADWPAGSSMHDVTTAVATELAGRIGGGQPVDLIGHSFGGTVALRIALENPALVRSLTLFEPVLFAAAQQAGDPEAAAWLAEDARFAALLAEGDRDGAARLFHSAWGNGIPLERLPDSQRQYIVDRIHAIPAASDVIAFDRPGLLTPGRIEALTMPVLLAEGEKSPPVIHAVNRAIRTRLPGLNYVSVPGAGHMLPISHAAGLAPAVRRHLEL